MARLKQFAEMHLFHDRRNREPGAFPGRLGKHLIVEQRVRDERLRHLERRQLHLAPIHGVIGVVAQDVLGRIGDPRGKRLPRSLDSASCRTTYPR